MALAFKRAQKDVETAIEECNKKLQDYGPGTKTIEVNFEEIKKIEGKTNNWVNNEEKPRNEIGVLYLAKQGISTDLWYLINYYFCKDDKDDIGKTAFNNMCDKIYITVDDKGKDGNQHEFKFNGKTLEWRAHLDFNQYVCQTLPYDAVWKDLKKIMDEKQNLGFLRAKKALEEGSSWNLDRLKQVCPKMVFEYDYDGFKKVSGFSDQVEYQKEIAKSEACVKYVADQMQKGVIMAFESVAKDELGKEAINEFTKSVFHVDDQGPGTSKGKHEVKKNGTELHFYAHLDFTGNPIQYYPYDEVAKQIEEAL